jgi:hypothetical protein
MATDKLQARRTVYIGVPHRAEGDLKTIFKITENVLGKLGCGGCHSGFDFRWVIDPYVFNEKGESFGG